MDKFTRELEPVRFKKAKEALVKYASGEDRFNSGWNILRYADQEMYCIAGEHIATAFKMFRDWYPRDARYIILRLAKAGMLEMKET